MTMTTARHGLPLLAPGQAQKELFHNEALAAIDVLLHASVEGVGLNTPPVAPGEGQSWIIGAAPTAAWVEHAHHVASWTAGGWRFQTPVSGFTVAVAPGALRAAWDGTRWVVGAIEGQRLLIEGKQVIGAQRPAISDPVAGSTIDGEARSALGAVLAAMRAHGLIA